LLNCVQPKLHILESLILWSDREACYFTA